MTMNANRNYAVDVLKIIAALLVMNSHVSICYQDGLKMLASGGGWATLCSSFVQVLPYS